MDEKDVRLARIVDELEALYGPLKPPVTKPFDIIVHENASYLVDDARRLRVFRKLRHEIGPRMRKSNALASIRRTSSLSFHDCISEFVIVLQVSVVTQQFRYFQNRFR